MVMGIAKSCSLKMDSRFLNHCMRKWKFNDLRKLLKNGIDRRNAGNDFECGKEHWTTELGKGLISEFWKSLLLSIPLIGTIKLPWYAILIRCRVHLLITDYKKQEYDITQLFQFCKPLFLCTSSNATELGTHGWTMGRWGCSCEHHCHLQWFSS